MHFFRSAAVLYAALAFVSLAGAASVSDFLNFSHPSVPGRLYVPPEATDPTTPRPLILFLHGAGETGTNNLAQINGNIDNLLQGAKDHGAYLYAPQATTFTRADTTRTTNVMSMIDQALLDFNVDPNRLYVTGLSMGGGGVWNMLNRFDDRFAAGVPIAAVSPGGDFSPANLVGKPSWAFHARNDTVVSPVASRNVVNSILATASAAPVSYPPTNEPLSTVRYSNDPVGLNYTEWPDGGHGIWGPVYNLPGEGTIFGNLGAPLTASDPLIGKDICVVGDGTDIQSSASLFVYKSNEMFNLASPSFQSGLTIDSGLDPSRILLGSYGTVFANRLGGFRAGIIAAAVDVPEPTAILLIAFAVNGVFSSRRGYTCQIQ